MWSRVLVVRESKHSAEGSEAEEVEKDVLARRINRGNIKRTDLELVFVLHLQRTSVSEVERSAAAGKETYNVRNRRNIRSSRVHFDSGEQLRCFDVTASMIVVPVGCQNVVRELHALLLRRRLQFGRVERVD
jgi:hypothetical protein